jgi:hypothetical protein
VPFSLNQNENSKKKHLGSLRSPLMTPRTQKKEIACGGRKSAAGVESQRGAGLIRIDKA